MTRALAALAVVVGLAGCDLGEADRFLSPADVEVTAEGPFPGADAPEYNVRVRNRSQRTLAVTVEVQGEEAGQVVGQTYAYVPDLEPGERNERRVPMYGVDPEREIDCSRLFVSLGDGTTSIRNQPLGRFCR